MQGPQQDLHVSCRSEGKPSKEGLVRQSRTVDPSESHTETLAKSLRETPGRDTVPSRPTGFTQCPTQERDITETVTWGVEDATHRSKVHRTTPSSLPCHPGQEQVGEGRTRPTSESRPPSTRTPNPRTVSCIVLKHPRLQGQGPKGLRHGPDN